MKKIIILALSVLFVLCFLSCDGSVYSSVIEDESTGNTITFAIGNYAGHYKFIIDNEVFDTYTITTTASTWAELISEGVNITIALASDPNNTNTYSLSVYEEGGYVILSAGIAVMTSSDIFSQSDIIRPTDNIVKGSTYYVNFTEG